jgi:hypothetical protein
LFFSLSSTCQPTNCRSIKESLNSKEFFFSVRGADQLFPFSNDKLHLQLKRQSESEKIRLGRGAINKRFNCHVQGPMLWFLKYFRRNNLMMKMSFLLKILLVYAKMDRIIGFQWERHFSPKIGKKSHGNIDHNIDPRHFLNECFLSTLTEIYIFNYFAVSGLIVTDMCVN